MELWYALVDLLPFDWAQPGSMYFMKNALLAVLVISPLFGVLSTMVVHSRMSFFSDALGHSAFTGMAIGAICGFNEPTWAAVLFAVVFALLFNLVRRRSALADSRGVKVFWQETVFSVAIAVVVTVSMTWVGLLVINSLLVLPAAAARNVSRTMFQYHLVSLLGAVLAGIAGLMTSYYVGSSAGAAITLYLAVWFLGTFLARKKQ